MANLLLSIFDVNSFEKERLQDRFREIAYLNSIVEKVSFKETYKFKGGISQFVIDLNKKEALTKVFSFNDKIDDIEVDVGGREKY